ncbi:hypothetical protein K461DRAFT_295437 [Myriangium duriaei CBS 260.36]|uniref:Myb-like domain-containing protein n=1 Tax=Myriangium duriaei CBS 260.36 TaxID=1168546 RepID=A0A9P4J0U4_9PEZI|nr:hypothetical protein K461DRAFT_295437 [Myriangium duriaei CBS 260.36]
MAKRTAASVEPPDSSPPGTSGTHEKTPDVRRSTRSTSRELGNNPQSTSGRSRRTSRQKSVELDGVAAATAALDAHRRAARANPQDLEPVEEEEGSVTYGRLKDDGDRNTNIGLSRQSVVSQGGASTYSGFTNRTSFSQEEIRGLDTESILGGLQELDRAAEVILNYVAPQGVDLDVLQSNSKQLFSDQSVFRRRLIPKLNSFNAGKESFGQQTFINPEHILRFLLDLPRETELLSTNWRPDEILYKANLVTMLQMMYLTKDSDKFVEVTETLYSQFPGFALSGLTTPEGYRGLAGESALVDETAAVANEIRTHLLIHSLANNVSNESIDRTLANLFLADSDEEGFDIPDDRAVIRLRPFDLAIPPEYTGIFYSQIHGRYRELKNILDQSNNDIPTVVEALRNNFSWDDCCVFVLDWARLRLAELRHIMADRGGVENVVAALEQEVHEVESRTDPQLLAPEVQVAPIASSNLISKSNIEALKRRRQQLSSAPAPFSPAGTPALSYENPAFIDQASNIPLDGLEEEAVRQLTGFKDQENQRRFIDQQHGAHRVTFDDTQASVASQMQQPSSSRIYDIQSSSVRGRKRGGDDDEDYDPTQDEGFQTDNRVHLPPHRAPRAQMMSSSNDRNVLPRTSAAHDVSEVSHVRRERQNPGRAIETLPPPTMENGLPVLSQVDNYQRARVLAKMKTAQVAKPARTRNKFSQEEEERVLDLIGAHGPQYATIKRIDEEDLNVLVRRNAEDIRFKVRNMKVDYLKSGVPLPPNFEEIKLGKKEIDQLERLGINYEQDSVRSTNHHQ